MQRPALNGDLRGRTSETSSNRAHRASAAVAGRVARQGSDGVGEVIGPAAS